MPFRRDSYLPVTYRHLHQDNLVTFHRVGAHRTTKQCGILVSADRNILLYLYWAETVFGALGLNRNRIMYSALVHADIKFVRFDLPDTRRGGP